MGPGIAFASEKGLLAPETRNGAGLALLLVMAFTSLKGSWPKLRFRPPSTEESLPPRVRDIRRLWASRSNSLSSMLSRVRKSGLLVTGLVLGFSFSFILPPSPRAANMSFLFSFHPGSRILGPLSLDQTAVIRSLKDALSPSLSGRADEFFLPLSATGDASMN